LSFGLLSLFDTIELGCLSPKWLDLCPIKFLNKKIKMNDFTGHHQNFILDFLAVNLLTLIVTVETSVAIIRLIIAKLNLNGIA
jgi:hypothetical protein